MGTLIKLYMSKAWLFLRPFLLLFLNQAGAALAGAALEAVKVAASTYNDTQGELKREAAFSLIEQELKKKGVQIGVDVTTSMIYAAIEVAVQNLKATEGK